MTEPQVPVAANGTGRITRIVLAVSLALNLAVAGMVGGAMLRHSDDGPRNALVRDLGFGLFTEALTPQDRITLRDRFLQRSPGFRQERRSMRDDLDAILVALRADPFDPAALDAVLKEQNARLSQRLDLGQSLIRDFLVELPTEARRAFADRLEQRLMHGPGGKDRGPGETAGP